MKIGLISEMYGRPTPPEKYGGIAATISDIAEELVRRGRDVTLFATKGSRCHGRTVILPEGDAPARIPELPPYVNVLVSSHLQEIDVWIDGSHHKRFARYCTQHRPEVNVLCPSWNPNKEDVPCNTVVQSPHMIQEGLCDKPEDTPFFFAGIPLGLYEPGYEPTGMTVSINVLSEYKGTDLLVAAAAEYGFPLRLYGPISGGKWYTKEVKRNMEAPNVEYMGECGMDRIDILRNAAMSFTLSVWHEPGSRASIESFACGCPVVALPSGCFPYYIEDGVNGALCEGRDPKSIYEAYQRVLAGGRAMRVKARETALEKFDLKVYVDNWEKLFHRVIGGDRWP